MARADLYEEKKYNRSSHQRIAIMLEGLPKGTRVLDVGTASGTLAKLCQKYGYKFYGIEPVESWAKNAREYYSEIHIGSLEQTPDSFLQNYTAVVCGDILEHLVDPAGQLNRLVAAQPNGCIFIISVPNIANLWIRLNLLFGRFSYSERGILDRSHLHFFTKKSYRNLLHEAGLVIVKLETTPIPLDLVHPFFSQNSIGRGFYSILAYVTSRWSTMLGYQFVVKARKPG